MQNIPLSKLLLVPLLILFGAVNTILLQLQNNQKDQHSNTFFHPFIQVAIMFFAQSLCFIPFLVSIKSKKTNYLLDSSGFIKEEAKWYWPLLPALCDLFSSTLAYVAITFTPASVWQMLRGGVIITTAIFSKIILRTNFTKSAKIGCILTFLGITLVQLFEIIIPEGKQSKDDESIGYKILGVSLLLASLIFNALLLISEKWIFQKYKISPFKMVFLQGLYGFLLISIVIAIACQIQCPWSNKEHCVAIYGGQGKVDYYLQSLSVFWDQISNNVTLLLLCIGFIMSIGISVPIAVSISKYINPLSRVLAEIARTILIWGFGIVYSLINVNDQLQNTGLLLNMLKLIGFILIVVGILIYHQVIKFFKEKNLTNSIISSEGLITEQQSRRISS